MPDPVDPLDPTDPVDLGRFAPGGGQVINRAAAVGFERGAVRYEQARPSYPAAAVELVVESIGVGPGRRVLDLAAGTGKFTRLLAPFGADLVAVEPVEAMRSQLHLVMPELTVLDGTAEAIPLPDGSVDAVVVAQAFHWFDAPAALAEVHRVLRSAGDTAERAAGRLALVWNERDEVTDWVRRFGEILVDAAGHKPYVDGTDWSAVVADAGGFSALQQCRFDYDQLITPDLLVARAASTSFVSALPDDEREACLDEVRRLIATDPELVGRPTFDFPYVTHVFWCERR